MSHVPPFSAASAKLLQSCPTLCDPIDGSPPGSPVPGIFQARILEWAAISFCNGWKWKWSCSALSDSIDPMDCSPPGSSIHGIFQARVLEWGAIAFSPPFSATAKSLQSCPTLCDPIDGLPPGSAVSGILQARTLEWVAISFSNAWKWGRSVVSDYSRPHRLQPTRLLLRKLLQRKSLRI